MPGTEGDEDCIESLTAQSVLKELLQVESTNGLFTNVKNVAQRGSPARA